MTNRRHGSSRITSANRLDGRPWMLQEDRSLSYPTASRRHANRLIRGDSLIALRVLQDEFAGKIKCIYLDPPYNTGATFKHYHDVAAHAAWLALMRQQAELLRTLLRPDGILFVSIDEKEQAYLTVLLDEVFGRTNNCGPLIWEKKKKPSFRDANLGIITEFVLAYARDRTRSPAFIGGVTTPGKKYPLNNAGNGVRILCFPAGAVQFGCPDQVLAPQDMSAGNIIARLLDRLEIRDGRNRHAFRLEGEWRYSQSKLDELLRAGEQIVISKVPFRPNHIRTGGQPKKLKNLLSIAHYDMSTYEDAAAESRDLFGIQAAFDYPKPEKLLATLLGAVTNPDDWVLDSFAGSGTTGAVAHKMGRRWIMIERGNHCQTHILPRMRKVIDGQDSGGITAAVGWRGGGGFRYFRLVPAQRQWGFSGQPMKS